MKVNVIQGTNALGNFATGLGNLKLPYHIDQWTNYFKRHFGACSLKFHSTIDIHTSACSAYRVDFDLQMPFKGSNKFSSVSYSAALCNSASLIYLLVKIGNNQHVLTDLASTLQNNVNFAPLGGKRFKSLNNDLTISFESDESGTNYLLITSKPDLFTKHVIFRFARKVMME
jgi:hypothetical protein